jgi:hypothetical protein
MFRAFLRLTKGYFGKVPLNVAGVDRIQGDSDIKRMGILLKARHGEAPILLFLRTFEGTFANKMIFTSKFLE